MQYVINQTGEDSLKTTARRSFELLKPDETPDTQQAHIPAFCACWASSEGIASLTWSMLTDAQGAVSDAINLQDVASKGRSGGVIWLNRDLKAAIEEVQKGAGNITGADKVIRSERRGPVSAQVVVNMMRGWYGQLGFDGCSSHSGRRTFITNAAKKISTVGGSIRDVQMLARHSSLQMTQRYIEADVDAQKRVVQLV